MRKKLLTVALAATMAISSVFSAFAETKDTLSSSNPFVNTGDEKLEGDFDVTYSFHTASTLKQNWDTFAIEFYSDKVSLGSTGKGYLTLRADAHGWWAEGWNESADGKTPSNVAGGSDAWKTEGTAVWDTWKTDLADADVVINAKRTGEKITVKYDIKCKNGAAYTFTCSTENVYGFGDYVYIHLTMAQDVGVEVNLSNVKFTKNTNSTPAPVAGETTTTPTETTTPAAGSKDNGTSPKTADTAAVAVVTIVALGAAVAVVASRKKVTE